MSSCPRCKGYFLDLSGMSEEQREATLNAMFKDARPQDVMDAVPEEDAPAPESEKAGDAGKE